MPNALSLFNITITPFDHLYRYWFPFPFYISIFYTEIDILFDGISRLLKALGVISIIIELLIKKHDLAKMQCPYS